MTDTVSLLPAPFEDRYKILKQLWLDGPHGGWLTFDRILGREVVLNMPYRPDDNRRFIAAAQLRARLRHTNLIPLFDFGITPEGKPFFTEPHLPILFLDEFLTDGSNHTLWKLARLYLQVCEAVRFIHASDLLHLNLTPSKVLVVQPFEEVFLVRGHPSLPAAVMAAENNYLVGVAAGTPGYMASEQLEPNRYGPATVQTDVYGLGGILYFILYGKAPTTCKGTPLPGRLQFTDRLSRRLARKLQPICLRALDSDRKRRQATVVELTDELIGALNSANRL
jgi:serine/threonine protein kinase